LEKAEEELKRIKTSDVYLANACVELKGIVNFCQSQTTSELFKDVVAINSLLAGRAEDFLVSVAKFRVDLVQSAKKSFEHMQKSIPQLSACEGIVRAIPEFKIAVPSDVETDLVEFQSVVAKLSDYQALFDEVHREAVVKSTTRLRVSSQATLEKFVDSDSVERIEDALLHQLDLCLRFMKNEILNSDTDTMQIDIQKKYTVNLNACIVFADKFNESRKPGSRLPSEWNKGTYVKNILEKTENVVRKTLQFNEVFGDKDASGPLNVSFGILTCIAETVHNEGIAALAQGRVNALRTAVKILIDGDIQKVSLNEEKWAEWEKHITEIGIGLNQMKEKCDNTPGFEKLFDKAIGELLQYYDGREGSDRGTTFLATLAVDLKQRTKGTTIISKQKCFNDWQSKMLRERFQAKPWTDCLAELCVPSATAEAPLFRMMLDDSDPKGHISATSVSLATAARERRRLVLKTAYQLYEYQYLLLLQAGLTATTQKKKEIVLACPRIAVGDFRAFPPPDQAQVPEFYTAGVIGTKAKTIVYLMAHLAAFYSLNDLPETDSVEIKKKSKLPLKPHSGQIFAIFRLLGVDDPSVELTARTVHGTVLSQVAHSAVLNPPVPSNPRFAGTEAWVSTARSVATSTQVPVNLVNHFVQLGTGEGKSVLLAISSAVLALLGFDVDCACYSKSLSQRDYQAFESFFQAFGLKEKIRYGTFQELCEAVVNSDVNLREGVKSLFGDGTEAKRKTIAASPKALIVDEVDVFFDPEFFGAAYSMFSRIQSPEVTGLIDTVWNQFVEQRMIDGPKLSLKTRLDAVKADPIFETCCAKYAPWREIHGREVAPPARRQPPVNVIEEQVKIMLEELEDFQNPKYEVDETDTHLGVGYIMADGSVNYKRTGYRTVFAYRQERQFGRPGAITDQKN